MVGRRRGRHPRRPGLDRDAGRAVVAVGLTGQMHGLVLLDANGAVLRPAILWNDQRTGADATSSGRSSARSASIAVTGNDALTGFTAPKLVWVRDHEPEVWSRIAHVLLPKDYLRYRLTDGYALDKADGAGTILFDLAARDWSPEILAALRIEPAWMPPTFEGPEVTGTISTSAAAATGLRAGTPVVAGAGTSRPTASASGPSRRARSRCRSGRPASSSPPRTRPSTSRTAGSTRSATPSRGAGT